MNALWSRGQCSVREIQESFPVKKRPAYTTVQTTVYRLEAKKALRRVKKIATALIFEAAVSREAAERRLIDDLVGLFGGRSRPIMAHLIESGTLTLDDVREAGENAPATRRRGETGMNLARLVAIGKSPMAIDSVCSIRGIADTGATTKSRAGAPCGVARGVVQISYPACRAHRAGRTDSMAAGSTDSAVQLIHCDGRDRSAIYGSGGLVVFAGDGAACRKPTPCDSLEHLGVRVPRYRLFVVGALATYPCHRARRLSAGSCDTDPGTVVSHSRGARDFRCFPAGSLAARRHFRPFVAGTTASRRRP